MAFSINPSSTFLFSAAILLALLAPASSALVGNSLDSGSQLNTGDNLIAGTFNFTMQPDCNLVLYNGQKALWLTLTNGMGAGCKLQLQDDGELMIVNEKAVIVWRSDSGGPKGKYSLVLKDNGAAVVYTSAAWSTGRRIN
ncbi:hypothetical protein HPP92_015312 [Vanilla planifolia]|uniref:Bulb-type lectin domain-containing protein n=1 Tax=Vanilla planifolia TaxID=51239 RepID=A0A835UUZ5_VANPL|nr:hypothetical protein HPP92_015312 [Vanilla planifolia]